MFIDPLSSTCHTRLDDVADQLRIHLSDEPPNRRLDAAAVHWLDVCLEEAAAAEIALLPRRMQRALEQMRTATTAWQLQSQRSADEVTAARWSALAGIAAPHPDRNAPDPVAVAE
jgi:hypothetical protein